MKASACLAILGLASASACASSTLINSKPSGAKIFLDGEAVGKTPYTMTDSKIVGSTTHVRLEAPGYQTLEVDISRNEELDPGALVAGIFLLVPLLWVQKYHDHHDFELQPGGGNMPTPMNGQPTTGQPIFPGQ